MKLFEAVAKAFGLSKSEARRQIKQGAIRINDKVLTTNEYADIFLIDDKVVVVEQEKENQNEKING